MEQSPTVQKHLIPSFILSAHLRSRLDFLLHIAFMNETFKSAVVVLKWEYVCNNAHVIYVLTSEGLLLRLCSQGKVNPRMRKNWNVADWWRWIGGIGSVSPCQACQSCNVATPWWHIVAMKRVLPWKSFFTYRSTGESYI